MIAEQSTAARSPYLDFKALAALSGMRFTTRGQVEGAYSGRHRSRQRGGAGEFVDFREYGSGEDLRRLDWKVYARTGKAFVRLHQDETNLLCTLAVDASQSMDFPSGRGGGSAMSKLSYARYLTTSLSHVIAWGQDQVGLALLGSKIIHSLPPGGTRSHVNQVQQLVREFAPQPSTTMGGAMRQLFEGARRGGVLMLLSDFLMDDVEDVFAQLRMFRHFRWEVVVLHLVHPQEEQLPDGTAFRFQDMESGDQVLCTPAEIRGEYQVRFAAHLAMVRQMALATGCDYRLVSTAVPYLQTLRGFLVERSG